MPKTLLEDLQDIIAYATTYTGAKTDIRPETPFATLSREPEDYGLLAAVVETRLQVDIPLDTLRDLMHRTVGHLHAFILHKQEPAPA